MLTLAVALAAVLVGSILQRVAGMGVGLVVAPVLSLLLGPGSGVLVTNMATVCSGFLITLSVRRAVEWKHAAVILAAGLPGIALGAFVVKWMPPEWLQIGVGAVVLLALAVTNLTTTAPTTTRRKAVLPAGLIGGFFNATAGVAGPTMVIYSRLTKWDQTGFAATMQPIFMTMGAISAAFKLAAGVTFTLPVSVPMALISLVLTILAGIGVGTWLSGRVAKSTASRIALALATTGGAVVLVRGVVALAAG